ncbi:sulfatase-like hydrolase/transferase [Opitutaceae bacterium]|nr:sulfatase-like hydrolase/transferase [Opitutaceae bacterium]
MNPVTRFGALALFLITAVVLTAADRPNILWITSEDNSSDYIGAFGDPHGMTPTIDRLAKEGVAYDNAYSNAAVCGPARTTLILGMYPPSVGGEHMRSQAPLPSHIKIYPQYLSEAGYYCTNNSKQDYNIAQDTPGWADSSKTAHWKNRPEGKPFFAIFNTTVTHESALHPKKYDAKFGVPPADVRVPAYIPDTQEARERIATYYSRINDMDNFVAAKLQELEDAGLADDTIVFYYSDHGGIMPRSKRFVYDSGTHVPLVVRFPEKWAHLSPHAAGSRTDEVVGFIDFAPTLLSLVGAKIPAHLQGRAFLGKKRGPAPEYAYNFRARADERIDFKRGVTDGEFNYIRNYLAYLPSGQHVNYIWENPVTGEWEDLFRAGKTNAAQSAFFEPAPLEELFDLANDPDEVNNLATDPKYRDVLVRMRQANRDHMMRIRDSGFVPEALLVEWSRGSGKSPHDIARDDEQYPLAKIIATADVLLDAGDDALPKLTRLLQSKNPVVQYWALINCMVLGTEDEKITKRITALTRSPIAATRIAAAEHLARLGKKDPRPVLNEVLLNNPNVLARLQAINALDHLQETYPYDASVFERSKAIWPSDPKKLTADWMGRYKAYDVRVMEFLMKE